MTILKTQINCNSDVLAAVAVVIAKAGTSPYGHPIILTPLYYGQFTWSLRDRTQKKAYFSKTDTTSIIQTLILVPLVSLSIYNVWNHDVWLFKVMLKIGDTACSCPLFYVPSCFDSTLQVLTVISIKFLLVIPMLIQTLRL